MSATVFGYLMIVIGIALAIFGPNMGKSRLPLLAFLALTAFLYGAFALLFFDGHFYPAVMVITGIVSSASLSCFVTYMVGS